MKKICFLVAVVFAVMLTACMDEDVPFEEIQDEILVDEPSPTETATSSPAPTETAAPTRSATVAPTETAPAVPTATSEPELDTEALRLLFKETVDDFFEDVVLLPMNLDEAAETRWIVYTIGVESRAAGATHQLALYQHDGEWRELSRLMFPEADHLFPGAVLSRQLGGSHWVEVQTNIGSRENCYHLYQFEADSLLPHLDHCHSSFASGGLGDLNADGRPDLILNQTDENVLCQGCNVWRAGQDFLTLDESGEWQLRLLTHAPDDGSVPSWELINHAVDLAQAGLWLEASLVMEELVIEDSYYRWNKIIILETASAHQGLTATGPLKMLNYLFLGDYQRALDELRSYSPADLFALDGAFLVDSPAVGYELQLAQLILDATDATLALRPDIAEAQYLRGLALYWQSPTDFLPAQRAIEQADALAPTDSLIADTLFFFYNDIQYR